MAWITLTRENLKTRFSKAELAKLPSIARAEGLTADQVLDEAVNDVVLEVRGYASSKHPLGPEGTIPDEAKNAALSCMVPIVIGRLPGLSDLMDDTRKTNAANGIAFLKRMADGNVGIVPPEEPAPEQAGNFGSEIVQCRPDIVGGGALDGL